MFKQSR